MSDFYTVLRRSLDRADAPDEEQRQEIYDRLRAVIVRKLDAHRPRLKDTEFRSRLVAFDGAVTRIEDEIAASFAAADDVFDELPYEPLTPALAPEPGADRDHAGEPDDFAADDEPILEEETFLFDDERGEPEAEADVTGDYAEAEAVEYVEEPAADDPDAYLPDEYEPEDFEPEEDVAEDYAPVEPEAAEAYGAEEYQPLPAEPRWQAAATPAPDFDEPEAAGTAGPSTMWGSAIDLAWDESTAQWHDPEEPVRPPPVRPAAPPPDLQARPDSEWDRRLQMALVEETVRSHGSAATPEWIAAENEPADESPFYEEGQWDAGTAEAYDDADPLPETGGGRFGAVTARLRSLSPGRLLRRSRREPPDGAVPESAAADDDVGTRVQPAFEDAPRSLPAPVQRRTSVRSIAIVEREEVFAEEPPRPLRALRDDAHAARPEPAPSARRAPERTPEPSPAAARPAARGGADNPIRPVRPTPAPAPVRADGRPQRTPPPRPVRPTAPDAPLLPEDDEETIRPAAPRGRRDAPPPPPAETAPARTGPQRGVRPRLPPPPSPSDAPAGEQHGLAPAANRAVRYLGADLDEPAEGAGPVRSDPLFAEAMDGPPQRRRLPPPLPTRNAPPEGRRVVPENRYGGRLFGYAVIAAIVVVVAVAAVLILPGLFGSDGTDDGTTGEQGIVLFGGTDPMVFQTGPDAPANFDADTAGGLVRVVSSASGAARAAIGPGISTGIEGRSVRIQLDVRGTPGRPATTLRLAYLRGNALLEWRTVTVTGEFAIVDAVWTIPTGVPSPNGDALLIAPGVPGDGTAVDIRRIVMDVTG
ncbi:MAG: hypothetical protein IT534_02670 [Bauldia sp.]|nr:hypothetical protein [Bauldia sp.]